MRCSCFAAKIPPCKVKKTPLPRLMRGREPRVCFIRDFWKGKTSLVLEHPSGDCESQMMVAHVVRPFNLAFGRVSNSCQCEATILHCPWQCPLRRFAIALQGSHSVKNTAHLARVTRPRCCRRWQQRVRPAPETAQLADWRIGRRTVGKVPDCGFVAAS